MATPKPATDCFTAGAPDAVVVLAALAFPVLVIDGENRIGYVNAAAEQFFEHSAVGLMGHHLARIVPLDSPVFAMIGQVRSSGANISEHGVDLVLQRGGGRNLSIRGAALGEDGAWVVLSFEEHATARAIERQLVHRGAARSVSGMASILAHEVKNPLSGIRGAAQLLEQTVTGADRHLTRLICEETDRICALVDRMDVFADGGPPTRSAVNIHEVLERVQRSAMAGFGRHAKFATDYDPSLPPVFGNFDQLVQVFMNLVKNAAEALPPAEGEIQLGTAFRRGVRLALPGGEGRIHLPLVVTVADNGPGIPADMAAHLFDPFVTTKSGGTGLGLALVAKVVNDHGGVIEFDTGPTGTSFRVLLPMTDDGMRSVRTRDS